MRECRFPFSYSMPRQEARPGDLLIKRARTLASLEKEDVRM